MKKILIILTITLLLNNNAFAGLNFQISKAVGETDVILLNENYSMECIYNVEDKVGEYITLRMKIDQNIFKESLVYTRSSTDIINVVRRSKINKDGGISPGPVKVKTAYSTDKKLGITLKKSLESIDYSHTYGRILTPVTTEEKKLAKNTLSLLKKAFGRDQDLKKALKKLKVVATSKFLGTASIESQGSIGKRQNFYVITLKFDFNHPDKEFEEFFYELFSVATIGYLVHVDSGLFIELPADISQKKTCKIEKDKSVIFEIKTGDLIY